MLAFAFNMAVHESIQFSPAEELRTSLEGHWNIHDGGEGLGDLGILGEGNFKLNEGSEESCPAIQRGPERKLLQGGRHGTVETTRSELQRKRDILKMKLRWSRLVTIASFLRLNDVQLGNPSTGVIVRKAHVSQLKLYFRG